MARVLRLPDHGRLIVCTDLQGCLRDFHRIVEVFDEATRPPTATPTCCSPAI
jgi:hypothetical protein